MKSILSEFGLSLLAAIVSLFLLATCSPISEYMGGSLYDMVVEASNNGKEASNEVATGKIETTTSFSQSLEKTYGENNDWKDISGTSDYKYFSATGEESLSLVFSGDKIEVASNMPANISLATLNGTKLTILDNNVNVPDVLIRDDNYYQLNVTDLDGNKVTYIIKKVN